MNRGLGGLYRVPVTLAGMDDWTPYTFAPSDPRAGILSLAGFLMLDPTHEGRTSPTIRGKSVRELLLCQAVPHPPANVNFAIVQDTHDPNFKTARERLTVHMENPACAGCHKITDPIGLGLENYDAAGDFRTHENGAPIDASGNFERQALHRPHRHSRSPARQPRRCRLPGAARRTSTASAARPGRSEAKWLEYAAQRFAAGKYRLPALMRRIATSEAFRAVAARTARTSRRGIARGMEAEHG